MPRQSKLRNKQIRERILNYVRAGTPFETAARASGIGESTLHLWRQRGSEASERRKNGVRLGPNDRMYLEFLEEIKEAEALAIADKISLVAIHGKNSWQAAAWFLERRRPEEWGRRDYVRQEVSGPEGQPLQTETKIGPFPIERLDRTYRDKIRREVAAELRETTQRTDNDDETDGLHGAEDGA
jgi:hypothetical protein